MRKKPAYLAGPVTEAGKAKALKNLIPGGVHVRNRERNGLFSEEFREAMRKGIKDSFPIFQTILKGEGTPGNPDPTYSEIIKAFQVVAPYVLTELKPVVDETLCRILAEELAADERIPFECIGDVVGKVAARLSETT